MIHSDILVTISSVVNSKNYPDTMRLHLSDHRDIIIPKDKYTEGTYLKEGDLIGLHNPYMNFDRYVYKYHPRGDTWWHRTTILAYV